LKPIDELAFCADVMTNASSPEHRIHADEQFTAKLNTELETIGSFQNRFESIPWIFIQYNQDSSWRFISWQLEMEKDDFEYRNVFQKSDGEFSLFGKNQIEISEREEYGLKDVYSAVYYDLIPFEDYYFILGYRRNKNNITQRICEVFKFENGNPTFGLPIFKENINTPDGRGKRRIIINYTSTAKANLNVSPSDRTIIFDHIISIPNRDPNEGGMLLVPDGSYSAFEFVDQNSWIFKEKLYSDIQATPLNNPLKSSDPNKKNILGKSN
jgi:hypothetical protein